MLLLLPTAFAALGSPVALIALPSLALRFISTNTAFWGTAFHYDATVMPILFIAAAEAIGRWRRASALAWPLDAGSGAAPPAPGTSPPGLDAIRGLAARARDLVRAAQGGIGRHGGPMMAAIAVALAFQFPLSNLWHGATYKLDAHVAAADAAMAVVPDGATVQTTLDLLAPLAARTDTFWIGNKGNPATQYIVFDRATSRQRLQHPDRQRPQVHRAAVPAGRLRRGLRPRRRLRLPPDQSRRLATGGLPRRQAGRRG